MRMGTTAAVAYVSCQSDRRALLRRMVLGAAVAAAVAAGVAGGGRAALAGTETWVGGGGGANWSDPLNWSGDNVPPVALDALVFGGTANMAPNNDNAANTQFNGITFAAGVGAFTLGGNAVVLGGDIVNNSPAAQAINLATSAVTLGPSSSTYTYTAGGLVLDGGTVNVSSPGGGAISLGQVTFGAAPQSANVSTLNVNDSVSMSGLTVQTKSASANGISVAAGKTLTVNGGVQFGTPASASGAGAVPTTVNFTGGGDFTVTTTNKPFYVGVGNQNLGTGDQNTARVDMTGLGNFTYNTGATGTGTFGVGWGTRPDGQLKLTPGTNTIVASQVQIGNSGRTGTSSSNNNAGTTSILFLGAGTNVINTPNLTIGNVKGAGRIDWVSGTSGSVTIAGQAGGASTADITLGMQSSATGTSTSSELRLAGHQATVQAGTVSVGKLAGATSATATGAITFDTGTFGVNSLQIGVNASGADANGVKGTFTLGGAAANNTATGVLTVNTQFLLGNDTNTSEEPTRAAFVVNGGTANVNTDIQTVLAGTNAGDDVSLTLAGGTLNLTGHNVGSTASPIKTVTLGGGTLSNVAQLSGSSVTIGGATLNNVARITGTTMTVTASPTVTGGGTALVVPAGGTLAASSSPLTLVSGLTVAGGTTASAGNVAGNVDVQGGARVAPGADAVSAGTLLFANDLTFEGGSAMRFKLTPDGSSGNDQVNVSGNLSFAGSVNLEIGALGGGATIGETYTLVNYSGTLTGDETNLVVIGPGSRKTFTVVPTASTPNVIQVAVGGSDPLSIKYVGNGGSTWQAATGPSTWVDGSSNAQQFFNQDTVTFDDTSTNPADVQLVGQLLSGGVTVSANRDYKFAGTGSLTGETGLTKALGGTLVVATNNTNTGTTDIQGGTVRVGDGGTSGSLGSGAINDNGTLAFSRSDATTVANAIGGSGTVVVENGTVTLTGANTYAGTTRVKSGAVLRPGSTGALGTTSGGDVTVENGGTLDIGAITTQYTGAPTMFGSTKVFHISGSGVGGAGAVANTGGANQLWAFEQITLDGDATIAGNRMDIGRDTGGTRKLDLGGHTLTLAMTGSQPILGIQDGTTVTAGNIVVTAGGLDLERSMSMDNGGGTVTFNTGTVLQAYQTTDGAVARSMVFKGNNTIGSGSTIAGVINSPMQLDGSVTLQALGSGVPGTGNFPLELKGTVSGVGGITKAGTNSVTLSGTNTYAGTTAVNAGTLVLSGSTTGSSSLAVANGAAAQVVTPTGGGPLTERFGALNLNTSGKFDIDGANLVLTNTSASTLVSYLSRGRAGDASWTGNGLMSASAQSGADAGRVRAIGWAVAGDAGLTGGSWGSVNGLAATDLVAKLTYYGDLNLDGRVNGDDYALLDRFVAINGLDGTAPARWIDGDVNYDGAVTSADFLLTDTAFGQQGGGLSPEFLAERQAQFGDAYVAELVAAVPEPTTVGLAAAAGSMLAMRRRRK